MTKPAGINYYELYQDIFDKMITGSRAGSIDEYFIYCFNKKYEKMIQEIKDGKHGNKYRYEED